MRILLDIDVCLDAASKRDPFAEDSGEVIAWAANHRGSAGVSAHGVAALYYLMRKGGQSDAACRTYLRVFLRNAKVIPLGDPEFLHALSSPLQDFEDALQVEAAIRFGADFIVTRNLKHFRKSPVPVKTPEAFLKTVFPPQ